MNGNDLETKTTSLLKAEDPMPVAIRAKKFAGTPMAPLFTVEDAAAAAPAEDARGYFAPGDTEFTYFDHC